MLDKTDPVLVPVPDPDPLEALAKLDSIGDSESLNSAYRTDRAVTLGGADDLIGRIDAAIPCSMGCCLTFSSGVKGAKSSSPAVIKSSMERDDIIGGATGGSM